jgi:hypothetical protein
MISSRWVSSWLSWRPDLIALLILLDLTSVIKVGSHTLPRRVDRAPARLAGARS